MKFYSRSRKKVTVLNLFYKGAVNAYFLTGSFFKKTVVFEAAIFVGQSEDGAEVRCEVSRRVETAVSRYSGPSALRFLRCSARTDERPLLVSKKQKNVYPPRLTFPIYEASASAAGIQATFICGGFFG